MRFGVNLANFGPLGDVATLLELAREAEVAGWDGWFLWDHVNWPDMGPHADPWIALGAVASRTSRLVLGTSVTPLPRRRPVMVARAALTLDALSGGRFVLGVGAGGGMPGEYADLGEEGSPRVRAEMLDEALALIPALWGEGPVDHAGRHYRVRTRGFGAPASGRPIPIWVGATWPRKGPMARAVRFDGIVPMLDPFTELLTPEQVRELCAFVGERRPADLPYDVVVSYAGRNDDVEGDRARAKAFEEAGATWLVDVVFPGSEGIAAARERIRRGPPRA